MAVVTFTRDRARHRSRRRTALVLGTGGVLGAAWMTGALAFHYCFVSGGIPKGGGGSPQLAVYTVR